MLQNSFSSSDTPSAIPEVQHQGQILNIQWADGSNNRFHAIWLRDNGQNPKTRDPGNQQKLITLQDIPKDIAISSATINNNQVELTFSPDESATWIDLNWLKSHCYDKPDDFQFIDNCFTTWGQEIEGHLPDVAYDDARSDSRALLEWLEAIDRYGIALMSGLPQKTGAVTDVIDLFGYVRETNYGRFFEVRTEVNPVNLAYTGKGLQVHTDNPYRDPVPTLQLLACLENDADGGDSIAVDSFRAVKILKKESPEYFDILSSYSARFDYQGSTDVHLHSSKPMIECSPEGQLIGVRFNNRSCDTLTDIPFDKMQNYYQAYRRLGEIMESDELRVRFKLEPDQLFIVDNTRVLHGRTGYSGSGSRWLQGAYADKDSLKSKISILRASLQ